MIYECHIEYFHYSCDENALKIYISPLKQIPHNLLQDKYVDLRIIKILCNHFNTLQKWFKHYITHVNYHTYLNPNHKRFNTIIIWCSITFHHP